jgi:hypothetical protein
MATCIHAPFVREELATREVSDSDPADVEENGKLPRRRQGFGPLTVFAGSGYRETARPADAHH